MIFSLVLTCLLLGIAAYAYASKLLQAKKIAVDLRSNISRNKNQ